MKKHIETKLIRQLPKAEKMIKPVDEEIIRKEFIKIRKEFDKRIE